MRETLQAENYNLACPNKSTQWFPKSRRHSLPLTEHHSSLLGGHTSGALQCCAITAGVATTDIILQSGALKDAQELPPNDSANLFILQCMTWGSLTLWCQETFQKRDTSSKHLGQSFYSFRIFKTKYAELKTSTIDSTRAAFLSCSRYGSRSGACSDQGGVCGYTWNLSYLHTFNWNLVERRPRGV